MIKKARQNAEKLGYNNVEFREGDIDNMPVNDNVADVIVSNCVLNLVPNKQKVITEIYRILKPNGHFSISDVVLIGNLPKALQEDAKMYVGCVAGAIQRNEYLQLIADQGFINIQIQKEKPIIIPNEILSKYLSEIDVKAFNNRGVGIFSVTVFAPKTLSEEDQEPLEFYEVKTSNCCSPSSGCC